MEKSILKKKTKAGYFGIFAETLWRGILDGLPPLPRLSAPSAAELSRGEIIVTTIGNVDGQIVSAVAEHLEKTFRFKARVLPELNIPREAYDAGEEQCDPNILIAEVDKFYGDGSPHILALTNLDLKSPAGLSSYCWSWGKTGAGVQIVSLSRLQTTDKKHLLYRAIAASQKRIAHTFGVPSSTDENNFAFSPARGPAHLEQMFLPLEREQEECAEFIRRYETELLPPVSDETLYRFEKESDSGAWIPSVLYAWALIEKAGSGYTAPPEKHRLKRAEKILRRAASQKPAEGFARLALAIIYEESGDSGKAFVEFKKAKTLNHTVPVIFYHIAWAALRRGDISRAALMLEKEFFISGIYPTAPRLKKRYYKYEPIQKLLSERYDSLSVEISARSYLFNLPLALANNFQMRNEPEKAAGIFKKTLENNPAYSEGRRNSWWAHNMLAWIYADKLKTNLEEALSHAQTAVSLRPKKGACIDTLGWIYYRMGDFKKALPLLEKASELDSDGEIKEHVRLAREAVLKKMDASRLIR